MRRTIPCRSSMRSVFFVALAASAILAGGAAPAAASNDAYCLQGPSWGYPGNCEFSSYEQCQATASGTGEGCGLNPAVAFAPRQERPPRYRAH
jgi:hypothetical protein